MGKTVDRRRCSYSIHFTLLTITVLFNGAKPMAMYQHALYSSTVLYSTLLYVSALGGDLERRWAGFL